MFNDTKINVTTKGKIHLGAVIGSNDFQTKYVNQKITEWCSELKILSEFAKSQPQAAYAAFCFGEQKKFSYFLWTIPEMNDLMKLADEIVQNLFLPAIIGETISEKERGLYSLPLWSEGLGSPLFSEKTCNEIENWLTITAPLVALIVTQGTSLPKVAEIKEATKITTQRKTKPLTNKSSKIAVNLDPDTGCYLQSKIQW